MLEKAQANQLVSHPFFGERQGFLNMEFVLCVSNTSHRDIGSARTLMTANLLRGG